jgi:hypothetical protein
MPRLVFYCIGDEAPMDLYRELLHTLHRAFFKSNGARIEVAHLSFDEPKRVSMPTSPPPGMAEAAPASPP